MREFKQMDFLLILFVAITGLILIDSIADALCK
jgi:hypothetical protein